MKFKKRKFSLSYFGKSAEEQIAFFPFLEDPSEVESLLQGLEREVQGP